MSLIFLSLIWFSMKWFTVCRSFFGSPDKNTLHAVYTYVCILSLWSLLSYSIYSSFISLPHPILIAGKRLKTRASERAFALSSHEGRPKRRYCCCFHFHLSSSWYQCVPIFLFFCRHARNTLSSLASILWFGWGVRACSILRRLRAEWVPLLSLTHTQSSSWNHAQLSGGEAERASTHTSIYQPLLLSSRPLHQPWEREREDGGCMVAQRMGGRKRRMGLVRGRSQWITVSPRRRIEAQVCSERGQ